MFIKIFQFINQDKAVLYPAMIVEFISLWLLKIFPPLDAVKTIRAELALLITGLLAFYVYLFTAECARQMILRKSLDLSFALAVSLRRYLPALFFCVLLPSPLLVTVFLPTGSFWPQIVSVFFFFAMLLLGTFPVVYVLSGVPAYKVYQVFWLYFRRKPWQLWRVFAFFLAASWIFNALIYALNNALPVNLMFALLPLLSGFRTVFLVYGLTLLFLGDQQISELV